MNVDTLKPASVRAAMAEFAVVLISCFALSVLFTMPWHPNGRTIPLTYQGEGEFFGKLDATMWTYMLAWGAEHPDRFYSAPPLLPLDRPLVANDPRLTEGILSIPIFRAFPPILAWGITMWCALTLTAVGCYYAGKSVTASRWGGAALTVLFAFGAFRANHVCHIEGIFIPFLALAFALMIRFLEMPKWAALIAFAAALAAAMVEYSYIAVALAFTLPPVLLWAAFRRHIPLWKCLLPLVLAAILMAPLLWPVVRRYAEFHYGLRMQRDIFNVDNYSADLFTWITGPTGQILPPFGGSGSDIPDSHLFPGFVAVLLGAAGCRLLWRKSPETCLVGIVAFILSFGTLRSLLWELGMPYTSFRTPYELLYDLLLPLKAIRAPARLGEITHIVLALGAAMVVVRMSRTRKGALCAVLLLSIAFLEARQGMHAVEILPARMNDPVYQWLGRQSGDFAIMEAPMGSLSVRKQHLVEGESLLVSLVHSKRMPNGTMAANLPWHDSIAVNTANPAHPEARRLLQVLGIRYVVVSDPDLAADYVAAGYQKAFVSPSGATAFEVPSPLSVPRNPREVTERLASDEFYMQLHQKEGAQGGRIKAPAEYSAKHGQRFVMPVFVQNTGRKTWAGQSFIYGHGQEGDIVVGIRCWRRVDDGSMAKDWRGKDVMTLGMLSSNLLPGENCEVFVTGIAPERRGSYLVELDFATVGGSWVSPPDRPPVTMHMRVE
jgi:hypothetical protein